jgi:SAM-dependent methyltransferase
MPDFRENLYRKYVTKSRTCQPNLSRDLVKVTWEWYEFKYLPLLKGLDCDAPILEIGCGPGYLIEFFKGRGFSNVSGIDISQEEVDSAVKRGLDVKHADAFQFFDSSRDSFSAIIAVDFFEHFNKEEIMELLDKIKNALKTNGRLIITMPNGQGLFSNQIVYGDFTHLSILTPESLKQVLTFLGFDGIRFYETGPAAKNITGIVRLAFWKFIKATANMIRIIETGKTQQIWTENFICFCRKP